MGPYDAPTRSTANVWPEIGTGVKPSMISIWAARATSPAPAMTRIASVASPARGKTASLRVAACGFIAAGL
jgi:hypothetical protein